MSQYKGTPASTETRFQERTENNDIVVKEGRIKPVNLEIERDDVYNTYDDPILTSPEKAIARFRHYETLGVNHVMGLSAFGEPVDQVIHCMEVMAKHVLPVFAESEVPAPASAAAFRARG
jgi:hypothetical protein